MILPLAATELAAISYRGLIEEKRNQIERFRAEFMQKSIEAALAPMRLDLAWIEFSTVPKVMAEVAPGRGADIYSSYIQALAQSHFVTAMSLFDALDEKSVIDFEKRLAPLRDGMAKGDAKATQELYDIIVQKIKDRGQHLGQLAVDVPRIEAEIDTYEGNLDFLRKVATGLQILGLVLLLAFESKDIELMHGHSSEH